MIVALHNVEKAPEARSRALPASLRAMMAFRFRRSIRVAPGVRINLGKKSASVSIGRKGMRFTQSTTGRSTRTLGIPGTGMSWTSSSSPKRTSAGQEAYVLLPRKRHSVLVHVLLAVTTVGLGNLIYWWWIVRENRRRGY